MSWGDVPAMDLKRRPLDNMSLEADEAGGRVSGRKRPPTLPSSSQLNSRSLCRRGAGSVWRSLRTSLAARGNYFGRS